MDIHTILLGTLIGTAFYMIISRGFFKVRIEGKPLPPSLIKIITWVFLFALLMFLVSGAILAVDISTG